MRRFRKQVLVLAAWFAGSVSWCAAQSSAASDSASSTPAFRLLQNPFVQTAGSLVYRIEQPFSLPGNDYWFYVLAALLLLLGAIRGLFWKYFSDLLQVFRQTTIRQKSTREQLLQNRTAALAMNAFFGISAGVFLNQLAIYRQWVAPGLSLSTLALCVTMVMGVYTVKYVSLKLSGWLFGVAESADAYIFMVFLLNKVVGLVLLPASLLLAFGSSQAQSVVFVLTLCTLAVLYIYRYVIAIPLVRANTKGSSVHFFIYLYGFEIMPMLVVYKLALSIVP